MYDVLMRLQLHSVRAALAVFLATAATSIQAADKPRIAVIFEERVQGVFGLSGSWMDSGRAEESLLAALREAGYTVVDPQTVRANLLRDQAVQVLAGDEKAAIAAGSRLQAPYVIVGKGFAKSAGAVAGSSMKSMQAQVQLNALDAQRATIVASSTATAAKPHVDETTGGADALFAAGADAAAKLLSQFETALDAPAGDAPLKVSISGLRSYRHYLVIKDWIEHNVKGFRAYAAENYTAGSADLDISGKTTGGEFARQIALAKFDGFVVNPLDVGPHAVTLKVIVQQ